MFLSRSFRQFMFDTATSTAIGTAGLFFLVINNFVDTDYEFLPVLGIAGGLLGTLTSMTFYIISSSREDQPMSLDSIV
jgi:hypothetical protein